MRQLQRETSNVRSAVHGISTRQSGSRFILPTPPLTGAITGTVTEEGTGTPVVGTRVEIYNSAALWVDTITTNSSGVYTSNNGLDTGDYFLRTYDQSGHINEVYDDIQCPGWCTITGGTPVSVTDGATTTGVDFVLTPGGRISGTVTDDDTSGAISGLYIEFYDASGSYMAEAESDVSGNYINGGGLPTGTYYARTFSSNGYISELSDDIQCVGSCTVTGGTTISVTLGVETADVDFELTLGGRITGTFEDGTSHLLLSAISMTVYNATGTSISYAYSNSSGIYTTDAGLPSGTYFVRAFSSTGYINELYDDIQCPVSCTPTDGTPIGVTEGNITSGIDFDLLKGGVIKGTVTAEGSGTPLDSGYVRIYDASGTYVTNAYPDDSGNYQSPTGLVTGSYYALARSFEGYLKELYDDIPCATGCTITDGTPIAVTTGSTTSDIDFVLTQGGFIAGTVTEAGSSNGLDEGHVSIYDDTGSWTVDAYPAATGAYVTATGLPAGTYYSRTWSYEGYFNELYDDISCTGGCTVTDGTAILVTAGSTTTGIDFELLVGGLISGSVTDQLTGLPLDFGRVEIYNAAGTYVTRDYTDSSGQYTSQGALPAGTYYARTWSFEGYVEELYDDISCADGCVITSGTPIVVTLGSTTFGIDFDLDGAILIDGFESGDLSAWSRTVP